MKTLDVMSIADAAAKIGIREKTLRRRINRGTVKTDMLIGKQVIHKDTVNALRKAEARKKKRS